MYITKILITIKDSKGRLGAIQILIHELEIKRNLCIKYGLFHITYLHE